MIKSSSRHDCSVIGRICARRAYLRDALRHRRGGRVAARAGGVDSARCGAAAHRDRVARVRHGRAAGRRGRGRRSGASAINSSLSGSHSRRCKTLVRTGPVNRDQSTSSGVRKSYTGLRTFSGSAARICTLNRKMAITGTAVARRLDGGRRVRAVCPELSRCQRSAIRGAVRDRLPSVSETIMKKFVHQTDSRGRRTGSD